jgi:hypothetical protein
MKEYTDAKFYGVLLRVTRNFRASNFALKHRLEWSYWFLRSTRSSLKTIYFQDKVDDRYGVVTPKRKGLIAQKLDMNMT